MIRSILSTLFVIPTLVLSLIACSSCGSESEPDDDIIIDIIAPPEGYLNKDDALTAESEQVNGRYIKTFNVEGKAGNEININIESTQFNPIVRLYEGDLLITENIGTEVMTFDGQSRLWGAGFFQVLERSGTYRIVVTSVEMGVMGEFSLEYYPE